MFRLIKKEGNALVYNRNDDSTFVFYVPENYFKNTSKISVAEINGQYVSMIGLCNWSIIDKNGKMSKLMPFNFPTMFLCKPREIEKVKNLQLDNTEASDYRLLKFKYEDEIVSQCRVPQLIDNVEILFKMAIMTAKIPTTIPYDQLHQYFLDNIEYSGNSYSGVPNQMIGIFISQICRDVNDVTRPFRLSKEKR